MNLDYKDIYEKYIKPEKELAFYKKLYLSIAKSFCGFNCLIKSSGF